MDKRVYISNLYDFYSPLLTDKQKKIFELYYFNDLSLNEIADEFSITKQGVRDSIVKSEGLLIDYEKKLHLLEKFNNRLAIIESLLDDLSSTLDTNIKDKIKNKLINLKNID